MPTEHGGWSLTLEPVVLGLLVAWSWPGLALGLAAMLAFLARTPLKLVLVDRWRGRWLARTRVAARVATVELFALVVLVAVAAMGADGRWFWLPLIAAAPLVAIELWFDMRSRGRRLLPELAGTIGIGSVAAAIALLGDAETAVAMALWLVVAARAAAAIPYARTQVLRGHGRP
ncbi:MAG: YwiC-like family protein, partial [Acidimicrobiales bacterium]